MENQIKKNNLAEDIQEKVKTGQIKMKPRVYFIIRSLLLSFSFLIIFLFLVYLISFIIFSLKATGIWFLPGFGIFGMKTLAGSLPWILILFSVLLILALEFFAEKLSFVYRRPIVYSLLLIIILVLGTSFLVSKSPLHPGLFEISSRGKLPIMQDFYSEFSRPGINNVYQGIVVEPGINFKMEAPSGKRFQVFPGPSIKDPFNTSQGDRMIVVGEKNGDIIKYFLIRKIEGDLDFFPLHKMKSRNFLPR